MLDARNSFLDPGQIMDDLTPMSRQDGGVFLGILDLGCHPEGIYAVVGDEI